MGKTIESRNARPDSLTKRDKFIIEATQQFNTQGYYDTRLEDIAEKLGVCKTSLSYHFKSKEGLLAAAYSNSCDFSEEQLKVAATARTGLDRALAYIESHLRAHANALCGLQSPLALLNDLSGLVDTDHEVILIRYQSQIHSFKHFLCDGIRDGSVSISSVDAATFFAFNVLNWSPNWLETVPEHRRNDAIESYCDILRNGLCTSKDRPKTIPISRSSFGADVAIFDRGARNNLKREAFLRTGIRYLNQNGYRKLSLDDIAAELGVTRGAFYYQIADKDTFLFESFDRTCNLIEEALELSLKRGDTPALVELEQSVRWLFEGHLTGHDPLLKLNLIDLLGDAQRISINTRLRKLRALYAELIARGMMDGSIRTVDIEAAEYIIFGAIFLASGRRLATTTLAETWSPQMEPVSASAAYFEPLIEGFSGK